MISKKTKRNVNLTIDEITYLLELLDDYAIRTKLTYTDLMSIRNISNSLSLTLADYMEEFKNEN